MLVVAGPLRTRHEPRMPSPMDRIPIWTLLLVFLAACGPNEPAAEPSPGPAPQLPEEIQESTDELLRRGDRSLLELSLQRLEQHLARGGALNPAQALAGRVAEGLMDPTRALLHYRAADLSQDAQLSVRRGALELDAGEVEAAAVDLRRASDLGLDSADLHYQMGRLAEERGDLAAAREAFIRSLQRAPARPAVHFSMSRVLDGLGDDTGAEQAMAEFMRWTGVRQAADKATDLARAERESSAAALAAAQAWYAAGEFERCEGWARHALKLQSDLHAAELIKALAAQAAGDSKRAASLLDALIAAAPEYPDARWERAWVYLGAGEQEHALGALELAVTCAPKSAQAQHQLGLMRLELGQSEAALRAFDSALVLEESLVDAHLGAAQVCYGLGKFPEARAHWQRTLQLVPGHTGALQSLAVLDREQR